MADTYLVRWDFNKASPPATGDHIRRFGTHNEGFTVSAETLEAAREAVRVAFHVNPFYVTIELVEGPTDG